MCVWMNKLHPDNDWQKQAHKKISYQPLAIYNSLALLVGFSLADVTKMFLFAHSPGRGAE